MVARRHTTLKIVPLLFALCSIGAVAIGSQRTQNDCSVPLWSANVSQDIGAVQESKNSTVLDPDRSGIAFFGDRIIAYVVNTAPGLSSRTDPEISPYRLTLAVLDASTGKPQLVKEMGTRKDGTLVQPVSGGLLVRTGELLRLLSGSLEEVARATLSSADNCFVSISSSQETVMANCFDLSVGTSRFTVMDGSTLSERYSWSQSPALYNSYSISDGAIAAARSNWSEIVKTQFGSSKWELLWKNSAQKKSCVITLPTLISGDSVLFRQCREELVLTDQGSTFSFDAYGAPTRKEKITVSRNGRFVATSLDDVKIERHFLSEDTQRVIGTRIAIYDLTIRRSFSIDVVPLPHEHYDFALSSDGSKLAILNNSTVTLCHVPVEMK